MPYPDQYLVSASLPEVRRAVAIARDRGHRIGCVPTMGALHAGHMSLVEECRRRTGFVVATIFVNPSQFAPQEDLSKYPRPLERDLQMCRDAGVDLVFVPEIASLYPPGYQSWVTVEEVTKPLEGAFRATHFRGVATIVMKLFHIIQPDVACFGAKDYQQQTMIRRMVTDLDMPIEIAVCATVREPDGLAMSSRNVYLSPHERSIALSLSRSLALAQDRLDAGVTDLRTIVAHMQVMLTAHPEITVDYVTIADPDSLAELHRAQPEMVALIAARVGKTRLIDNCRLALPSG